jgi:hypothetical protein
MNGMTEIPIVRRINKLCGERYFNQVSQRRYLLIKEVDGACFLEGIDRRVIEVRREVLDESDVWEKING